VNSIRVVSMLILPALFTCIVEAQCPPVQDKDKGRLIEYVQKKYKVPATMHLQVADTPLGVAACYRKLTFTSDDARSSFRLALFATPDLRFLSSELLDSSVDPIVEERQKAEALAAGLTRGDLPVRGKADAPVTIAVFSDFQCPYCSGFAATIKEVMSTDADKMRLVFHHLPLAMHPWARPAAEAAACAHQQGDSFFWPLHDFMFEHQKELTPDTLEPRLAEFTKGLTGFDRGKFAVCLLERKAAKQIDQDMAFAQENGINATPTAFVNGQKTQIVSPEQVRTLIRQLGAASKASVEGPAELLAPMCRRTGNSAADAADCGK